MYIYNNKEVLFSILKKFDEMKILNNVILIESWAEFFYQDIMNGYKSSMKTMDIEYNNQNTHTASLCYP